MFNEKVKQEYIDIMKENGKTVEDSLIKKFNKIASYEEKLGKDLYDFSVSEILTYYKSLFSNSLTTLNAVNSYYSRYAAWCLSNGLINDDQNHFAEITTGMLETCLNNSRMQDSILSREEILDLIDELQNPSDQFMILASFEGLTLEDMYYLRKEDIKSDSFVLHSGREFKVSSKLIALAEDAINEYNRYDLEGNIDKIHAYDPGDLGPIKRRVGTVNTDINSFGRSTLTRFRYIQEKYGYDISRASICEAGRIDYIINLKGNESILVEITDKKQLIEDRYGRFYSIKRWLNQYGKYLEA